MKTIFVIYMALSLTNIYSQFDEFNFFPLNVGNVWVYSGSANVKLKITGTTVLNGHLYYILNQTGVNCTCAQGQFNPFLSNQLYPVRIDSSNCNLLFSFGSSCQWYPNDLIKDSLRIRKGDILNNNCIFSMCIDSALTDVFGTLRRSKTMGQSVPTYSSLIKYVYGIGIYQASKGCFYSGCGYILNGCVIDGVVYGDTSFLTSITQLSTEIPKTFELFQNYPNPFNPVTKIKFQIPNSPLSFGEGLGVGLKIYNALGHEVQILVNESLQPGTYEVDWDASNYPSGIYFYELTSGDFTQTKKMVLLK